MPTSYTFSNVPRAVWMNSRPTLKYSFNLFFVWTHYQALTLLAAVDELACVDSLSCNEQLSPLLEPVWVTENHLCQGSSTARVVNDVLESREKTETCQNMSKTPAKIITTLPLNNPPSRFPWCSHGVQRSQCAGVWLVLSCAGHGLWRRSPHLFSDPWSHVPFWPTTEHISAPVRSNINFAAWSTSIPTVKMHQHFIWLLTFVKIIAWGIILVLFQLYCVRFYWCIPSPHTQCALYTNRL